MTTGAPAETELFAPVQTELSLDEREWEEIEPPPTNLPDDDGEPLESPWHVYNNSLLTAAYTASQGGRLTNSYIASNTFLYFSTKQLFNRDFRGPDVYIVKNVDGSYERRYWAVWEEDGRYPDVIIELLSPSTEHVDLGFKKQLYEQTFRTPEYFCCGPEVERLLGWRLGQGVYQEIVPDERGWLWSEELQLWLGGWRGFYMGREHTWLRFYTSEGELVSLPEEAAHQQVLVERQRAETAEQRADELAAQLQALKAELERKGGNSATAETNPPDTAA
jgi:Uma2 family endonuclease